jgi:hypothetical protein
MWQAITIQVRGGRNEMTDLPKRQTDALYNQQHSAYTSKRKKCLYQECYHVGMRKQYFIKHPALLNVYFEEEKIVEHETRLNGITID